MRKCDPNSADRRTSSESIPIANRDFVTLNELCRHPPHRLRVPHYAPLEREDRQLEFAALGVALQASLQLNMTDAKQRQMTRNHGADEGKPAYSNLP